MPRELRRWQNTKELTIDQRSLRRLRTNVHSNGIVTTTIEHSKQRPGEDEASYLPI